MEKEIIPLKVRLRYMVGLRFDSIKLWKGATAVARGYYIFFGFYWFCFAFFRKWPLEIQHRFATGFIFSYKPNPDLTEGALMWTNNKKCLRFDDPEDFSHAA